MLESCDSSGRCCKPFSYAAQTTPSIKQMCPESPKRLARRDNRFAGSCTRTGANHLCSQAAHSAVCGFTVKFDPALVFLHFLELGVDHIVLLLARATGPPMRPPPAAPAAAASAPCAACMSAYIFSPSLLRGGCQRFDLGFDRGLVARIALQRFFEVLQRGFDLLPSRRRPPCRRIRPAPSSCCGPARRPGCGHRPAHADL